MRSRRQSLAALLAALLPLGAHAGALYGTVRSERGPLGAALIQLACPRFAPGARATEVKSDANGSFALRLPVNGRCEMRVQRGNLVGPPFEVYLFENPVRFDFVVGTRLEKLR